MKEHQMAGGIQLWTLNRIIIVAACLLYAVMLWQTTQMTKRYHALSGITDEYLLCIQKAEQLDAGSNYLTEQARLYVMNQDVSNIVAYFTEANVTQRRERAVEELKNDKPDDAVVNFLDLAMQYSNELMEREIYAMKLAALSTGQELSDFPAEIQEAAVKEADSALSDAEKLSKARRMLFNSNYQNAKALVQDHTEFCIESVLDNVQLRQSQSEMVLQQSVFRQNVAISLLFGVNLLTLLGIVLLVIRPLQDNIHSIQEGRPLKVQGPAEFRYLARTYNEIFEQNEIHERLLRSSAEHDGLTELYNRRVFDQLREKLSGSTSGVTLLLLDVDAFKGINDQYGHEIGDQILKRVARLLKEQFRADDVVIRLGGDEFAVVMPRAAQGLRQVIEKKVTALNQGLKIRENDLPSASVSAGAAFSEHGFTEELYRNADWALYATKKNGRCGCSFYEELPEELPETEIN